MTGMRRRQVRTWFARLSALALALSFSLGWPARSAAYGVLSQEAIIDAAWDTTICPLLLNRFPDATEEQLREAHGYAYGGSMIQDLGYYPHGTHFFSDLAHYVRSGDFVLALLRDAKDLDGYAFALGALGHYVADNEGHSGGTNLVVPILYPELKQKYGGSITYEQSRLAHIQAEFGFDVVEVAQGRYAPNRYHDFIGFEVSAPLLEQAFQETYGLDLKSVLPQEDAVIASYRHDLSKVLPMGTRIAWSVKRHQIKEDQPSRVKEQFLDNLSRASYEKNWGTIFQPLTFRDGFLAFISRITPKFGPLKVLQFRMLTPETERIFEGSFNATLDRYRQLLDRVGGGHLILPNDNFDTGDATGPGQYRLNDQAHAELLDALAKQNFSGASPEIRTELLEFYGHPDAPLATKRRPKAWAKVQAQLEQLKKPTPLRAADGAGGPSLSGH